MTRRAQRALVPAQRLQPVVLGGDIGAYSLARTFHEAYGVRAIVVSSVSTGLVRHSRILEHVVEPHLDDADAAVAVLARIAAEHRDSQLILLGSADWHVRTIVEQRDRIDPAYTIPYVEQGPLDVMTDKERFGSLCAELGISHPTTIVHDVRSTEPIDASALRFPVIAKAADSSLYHHVEFPGKKKVFNVATPGDLDDLLARVRAAGYTGTFLVQDFIPGDDSGMRILTCYVDAAGEVVFSASGHVLLEEHTPGALGNPAAIITGHDPETVAQASALLRKVGWRGYANFDMKYDPRDGRTVFFELNPRLGRSNFYITAAGVNHVELYVRELIQNLPPLPEGAPSHLLGEHLYAMIPKFLVRRHVADASLRAKVTGLGRSGRATNPLWYRAETDPRRIAYLVVAQLNQVRKFARYLPRARA
ncbi:carboxylate--amine ligase [Sanguibacter sp. A247]|uniref:carboxylate--amine ligase n=1 Tax=unclassified Sanguibacter TaxID=2645534 RepID=UPI003FD77C64